MEFVRDIQGREHLPVQEELDLGRVFTKGASTINTGVEPTQRPHTRRHRVWKFLHHLQGFEGRYAARVVAVTGILAIPAYLKYDISWWNKIDAWWAVSMAWIMCHTM